MINKKISLFGAMIAFSFPTLTSCSSDDPVTNGTNKESDDVAATNFGKGNDVFDASEWYPGGEKGTAYNTLSDGTRIGSKSYSAASPATEEAGLEARFDLGEAFFTGNYGLTSAPYRGLGPAWVRSSCIHCHPSYGHGKFQTEYKANTVGNGYLLVIYHNNVTGATGTTSDGVRYTTSKAGYISEVTGMPQTQAMYPFKAPVDESGITLNWVEVASMPSGLPMKFADGTTFSLQYPDIQIAQSAFHTDPLPTGYEVRLESTIGVYGSGLLDAIPDDSIKAQWAKEANAGVSVNPGMWTNGDWSSSALYTARGVNKIKKFTYAMTRGSLQDGPGANAIWNITNVTRSDRHFLYTTAAWAKAMSEDSEVISYIKAHGNDKTSLLYPYYADGTDAGIAAQVYKLLNLNENARKTDATVDDEYKKWFVDGAPWNGQEEMADEDYYNLMVWHRGLAVPAARNLDNAKVQLGKQVFNRLGCATCHRPMWITAKDDDANMYKCPIIKSQGGVMPVYNSQKIYPYTDLVQHRLFMENDIRTGWCRTTPLWGRGLSLTLTGREDRMHDDRARNVLEAIMWHCYSKDSDAYWSAKQVYDLSTEEREALIAFINAI